MRINTTNSYRAKVLKYFESHTGIDVHLKDIIDNTGLDSRTVTRIISDAILRGISIQVIKRAEIWRYLPNGDSDNMETLKISQRARIFSYLEQHPYANLHLQEMMRDLGFNERQIRGNLTYMKNRQGMNIQTIIHGHIWKYIPENSTTPEQNSSPPSTPPPPPAPTPAPTKVMIPQSDEIMEVVGDAKDGSKLLRDEQRHLWKATRI